MMSLHVQGRGKIVSVLALARAASTRLLDMAARGSPYAAGPKSLKIGECARPSIQWKPGMEWKSKALDVPNPKSVISDVFPYCGLTVDAIKYDGSDTAKAWLKHPANQIQLVSLQGAYDFDGDGVTSKDEFRKLFKATGSNANADLIFDQLDTDRSGFLTQAEIKALGQDRTGKGARRDGGR